MIEKKTSPKGRSVRVTFELPAEVAAASVSVVGSFNEWNPEKHLMKLDGKKEKWTRSISFKPGDTHEFRYLIDGDSWRNDESADRYTANPFFCENGVLEV